MNQQLALAVQLKETASFGEFFWGRNRLIEQQIKNTLTQHGERFIYLWGPSGHGKSHLLQACCHAAMHHESAVYLPLTILKDWEPDVLDGMEHQDILCLDDVDAIAGITAWEEALFHLYNRIRDNERTRCFLSASMPPSQTNILMPDLKSRLSWGLVLAIQELSDEEKSEALILHAKKRGFKLPVSVCQFLINRCARNMHELQEILNRLDEASLIEMRKITIPFVKNILGL